MTGTVTATESYSTKPVPHATDGAERLDAARFYGEHYYLEEFLQGEAIEIALGLAIMLLALRMPFRQLASRPVVAFDIAAALATTAFAVAAETVLDVPGDLISDRIDGWYAAVENAPWWLAIPYAKPIERLLVTPRFHFVHHSTTQSIANSNYGFIFSIWDHLFNTYTDPNAIPPDDPLGLGYEISGWRLVLGLPPRESLKTSRSDG